MGILDDPKFQAYLKSLVGQHLAIIVNVDAEGEARAIEVRQTGEEEPVSRRLSEEEL